MDHRLILAILTGKLMAFLVKLAGGGATAAPGLIALKIDPNLVKKLSKKIKYGAIIISGTNGKTTTARLASGTGSIPPLPGPTTPTRVRAERQKG